MLYHIFTSETRDSYSQIDHFFGTAETMKLVIFVVLSLAALAWADSTYESYQNTYQNNYQNDYQNYDQSAPDYYQNGVANSHRRQSFFE